MIKGVTKKLDKIYRRSEDNHIRKAMPNTCRINTDKDPTQKSEWTKLEKSHEGYCLSCESRTEVMGYIIPVCAHCFEDLHKAKILSVVGADYYSLCSICLRFPSLRNREFTGVRINARLCNKCYRRHMKNQEWVRKTGEFNVNPLYLDLIKICKQDHIPLSRVFG